MLHPSTRSSPTGVAAEVSKAEQFIVYRVAGFIVFSVGLGNGQLISGQIVRRNWLIVLRVWSSAAAMFQRAVEITILLEAVPRHSAA